MLFRFVFMTIGVLFAATGEAAEGSCLREARQVATALCGVNVLGAGCSVVKVSGKKLGKRDEEGATSSYTFEFGTATPALPIRVGWLGSQDDPKHCMGVVSADLLSPASAGPAGGRPKDVAAREAAAAFFEPADAAKRSDVKAWKVKGCSSKRGSGVQLCVERSQGDYAGFARVTLLDTGKGWVAVKVLWDGFGA